MVPGYVPIMEQSLAVPPNVWQRLADPALKRVFASYLAIKPDSDAGRFEAAKLTVPDEPENSFLIYQIIDLWPSDPTVIAARDELLRETPKNELPTVEQTAREVYNLAIDRTKSVKERLEAYRLYGELCQMIGKAGNTTINNNVNNDNRGVFILPARSTDNKAFEAKAIEQQARLIASARPATTA